MAGQHDSNLGTINMQGQLIQSALSLEEMAMVVATRFGVDGRILTDASVGRNSFHLDFSDGVKDQSGLGNDWNALNRNLGGDYTA